MDDWKFWTGIAVGVAAMWGVAAWLKRRRAAALQKVADELGFEFLPQGDRSLEHRLAGFEFHTRFRGFGNNAIHHVLRREADGREIIIFDYRVRQRDSSDSTHTMTFLLLDSERLDLPQFTARPESVFQRIGHLLGREDIDFPEHPLFSRKYVLRSADEEQIRRVMTDDVIRAFENHTAMGISGISVEGAGRRLLVYYHLRSVGPRHLADFLRAGLEIVDPLMTASQQAHRE